MDYRKHLQPITNAPKTLAGAKRTYQRYGLYLAGKRDEGLEPKVQFSPKLLRLEMKNQRRVLERKWGNAVRLGDTVIGTQSRGLKGQFGSGVYPRQIWTERGHFTERKPTDEILLPPFIYFVPYDPVTREPIELFATSATRPTALLDALKSLRGVVEARTAPLAQESMREFRLRQRDLFIQQAMALYAQVEPLYEELKALKEYVETLK